MIHESGRGTPTRYCGAPALVSRKAKGDDSRFRGHRRVGQGGDGFDAGLDLIRAEAGRRNVTVHIVIDVIHVLEYLWGAVHCLHPTGDLAAETWVAGHARSILAGGSEQAAATIAETADAAGLRPGSRKSIDDAVGT